MVNGVIKFLKGAGIDTRAIYQTLSAASLKAAIREQGLDVLAERMRGLVPNLRAQYTAPLDEIEFGRYWDLKLRGLHAWQSRCALDALDHIGRNGLTVADIGDSSGHHGIYIRALAPGGQLGKFVSVNSDPVAVEKIRALGGEAILSRAEELDLNGFRPDLFLSFETMEHLTDPVRFLHSLATKGSADFFLMTVPYRRRSRFGGAEVRLAEDHLPESMTPEEVHIFELSPEDWRYLARFAGFRAVFDRIYRQYPLYGPMRAMAPFWRRFDFEGFYGLFLERDTAVADRYTGW